jgi:hypothetical protein
MSVALNLARQAKEHERRVKAEAEQRVAFMNMLASQRRNDYLERFGARRASAPKVTE